MRYATLGATGLIVSRLSLGAWTFAATRDELKSVYKVDPALGERLIHRAMDAGVNFFDTADRYAAGEAEAMLGQAVKARRDDVILTTKTGFRSGEALVHAGLSRRHILASIDRSLSRLKTDWVDVFLAHREDEFTPLEETLTALDAVVRSGKARYIGFSNWSAWKVAAAIDFQRANGLAQFTHGQMYYSLLDRDIEAEYLPMSAHYGLGLTVWSPLAMGFLTGKHTRESVAATDSRFGELGVLPIDFERGFAVVDALREIAANRGATVAQVALAWLLAKPAVTSLILGATRMEQLEENLAAGDLELDAATLGRLDALTAPAPTYPAWHARKVRDAAAAAVLDPPAKD